MNNNKHTETKRRPTVRQMQWNPCHCPHPIGRKKTKLTTTTMTILTTFPNSIGNNIGNNPIKNPYKKKTNPARVSLDNPPLPPPYKALAPDDAPIIGVSSVQPRREWSILWLF